MSNIVDNAADALRASIKQELASTAAIGQETDECPAFPAFVEAFESDDFETFCQVPHVSECPHCQKIVRFLKSRDAKFGELEKKPAETLNEKSPDEIQKGNGAAGAALPLPKEDRTMRKKLLAMLGAAAAIVIALCVLERSGISETTAEAAPKDPFEQWSQAAQPKNISEPKPPEIEKPKPAAISVGRGELDRQLDGALSKAPPLVQYQTSLTPVSYEAKVVAGDDEIWIDRVHQVTNTRRIDQVVTWADPSGLHLGQIVDANAFLETGILNPVRGLETRSLDFVLEGMWPTEHGDTSPLAATMESADLAKFTTQLQKIVADRLKKDKKIYFPFKADYRFEEASSVSQLSVALNVSASYMGAFKTDFSGFHAMRSDRRMVYLYLRQPMFRVTLVDSSLSGFLKNAPTDVEAAVKERRPGYVNSITYGRVVFAAFETSADSSVLKAALKWHVSGMVGSVDGELRTKYEKAISQSKMRVYVHGGKAAPVLETDTAKALAKLRDYLNETVEFSAQNLPAVIGFEVRDLRSGDLIGKKEISEYSAFEEPRRSKYRFRLTLTTASIRDDHDSFPSGDGDFRVEVKIPDVKESVLIMDRGLGNGNHTLNHNSGEKIAPSASFRFILDAREKDGFLNGSDDDVVENHPIDVNLGAMGKRLSAIPFPTKETTEAERKKLAERINEACRQSFDLTTPAGNVFSFVLDLIPPQN